MSTERISIMRKTEIGDKVYVRLPKEKKSSPTLAKETTSSASFASLNTMR
jgi:hypothetical protein